MGVNLALRESHLTSGTATGILPSGYLVADDLCVKLACWRARAGDHRNSAGLATSSATPEATEVGIGNGQSGQHCLVTRLKNLTGLDTSYGPGTLAPLTGYSDRGDRLPRRSSRALPPPGR